MNNQDIKAICKNLISVHHYPDCSGTSIGDEGITMFLEFRGEWEDRKLLISWETMRSQEEIQKTIVSFKRAVDEEIKQKEEREEAIEEQRVKDETKAQEWEIYTRIRDQLEIEQQTNQTKDM